jgi:glutamyl-tRNA reductase
MIEQLTLIHLPQNAPENATLCPGSFVLRTCQRQLIVNLGQFGLEPLPVLGELHQGKMAYRFLLETIVGLKSQVLAETEITAQFKQAYKDYIAQEVRHVSLMTILEKLFKDAKQIRSKYLLEVGQQSYAGITRKILHRELKQRRQVVVLGSGQLAFDIVKLLHRRFEITVCARNPAKLATMTSQYALKTSCWSQRHGLWLEPVVINTIGAEEVLFENNFFDSWHNTHEQERLFIDLSSPSVIQTPLTRREGIIRLEDIFAHGVILDEEKKRKVSSALNAIGDLVDHRAARLTSSYSQVWEESSCG